MRHQGFSIVELVVALAIMVLVVGIIFMSFANFRETQVLHGATEATLSFLSNARGKTLAAKSATRYGVHLTGNTITLFDGSSYSVSDPDNQVMTLTGVTVTTALQGGGSDVIFDRLTGKTSHYGTITIRVATDTNKVQTITISQTGIAGVQ